MKEIFVMLNNTAKDLFRKTSTWIGIIIAIQFLTLWLITYVYLELSDGQYHFYMNTKQSLERIYNVKIDKYDGRFVRDLTTEEEIIRKSHERWHLRNMFKK